MVNDMCTLAGILWEERTIASEQQELYNAGVPEKIIKERTGHRSLESLYTHGSEKQQNAVPRVYLQRGDDKTGSHELPQLPSEHQPIHAVMGPS